MEFRGFFWECISGHSEAWFGCFFCPQELQDFKVKPHGELTSADMEEWPQKAQDFLTSCARDIAAAPISKPIKKHYRLASLHAARSLYQKMRAVSGQGFERFEIRPPCVLGCEIGAGPEDPEPDPPRVLGISTDMGPSVTCWLYCMLYRAGVVAFHMSDTSHLVNGNILLALKHAGLWEHVLLNKVVYKSLFGPFGSEAWAQQVRESATMLAKVSHVHDPFFVHFLPGLLRDMGESPDRACDEAFVQSVHGRFFSKEMVEEVAVGPHLQFTRWGSVVDVGTW